jgi:hypothetical protein
MLPAVALIALSLGQPIPVPIPTPIVTPKVAEVPAGEKPKPQEFTARVGELKRFAGGDKAKWELAAGTVGADLVADGKGGCVFSAEAKGRYTLVCYTEGPCAWVVVTVGDGPAPGPAPVPPSPVPPAPTPPAPAPVPPAPPKPLSPGAEKLRAAVEEDGGFTAANTEALSLLAALVAAGIDELGKSDTRFTDELYDAMKKAGAALAKDKLPTAREWLTAELKTVLGTERRFITDDLRKSLGNDLAKLHAVIKEVSGK